MLININYLLLSFCQFLNRMLKLPFYLVYPKTYMIHFKVYLRTFYPCIVSIYQNFEKIKNPYFIGCGSVFLCWQSCHIL